MVLDARGLVLVIADKPDVERDAVAAAWHAAGGEVVRLGRFWDPPALDPTRVRIYGAEAFAQVLAQRLGLALLSPADDHALALAPALRKRAVWQLAPAELATLTFPVFVKSLVPKLIRSRVYASVDELRAATASLDPTDGLLASEVVALTAEARAWVLDGEVLTIACYEGAADLAAAAAHARAQAADPAVPAACVIDVGLTDDRGWVTIELNAAWGAGLNGCDPAAAARCVARASGPASLASAAG